MAFSIKTTEQVIGSVRVSDSAIVEYSWLHHSSVEYSIEKSLQCLPPKELPVSPVKQFLFDNLEVFIILLFLINLLVCWRMKRSFKKKTLEFEMKSRKESQASDASS
jgi:hypothetical protein